MDGWMDGWMDGGRREEGKERGKVNNTSCTVAHVRIYTPTQVLAITCTHTFSPFAKSLAITFRASAITAFVAEGFSHSDRGLSNRVKRNWTSFPFTACTTSSGIPNSNIFLIASAIM